MASKRPDILTEFLTRVSAIQKANGYNTDAGLKVFFGATPELGPDDPDEAAALIIGDDTTTYLGDETQVSLPIDIQALAKASGDQPWVTVELVLADIKHAIESGDRSMGGLLCTDMKVGRTRSLKREPGATTVGAAVQYSATYIDGWNA